jgi:hypothetical protein
MSFFNFFFFFFLFEELREELVVFGLPPPPTGTGTGRYSRKGLHFNRYILHTKGPVTLLLYALSILYCWCFCNVLLIEVY